jgi:hypothetical protein
VLNGGVSASEEIKSVEQWCFSIGINDEELLIMEFQQWKGKGETSAGQSCFGHENGDEMVDWSVLGVGRMKSAEQWCFSIGKNDEELLIMEFQQRKGKVETSAGRSCFGNGNGKEMADWSV